MRATLAHPIDRTQRKRLASAARPGKLARGGKAMTDGLGDLDATALAERIRLRDVTPQEALEAAMARAEKLNPKLNFIANKTYADASKRAAQPLSGPFAGVPSLIKDLLPTMNQPVEFGCRAFKAFVAPMQSPYADAVDSTGIVSLGKSTTPEFGLTATTESILCGPTRNPWNTALSSGGSSGGAAAAVASGVVPIAHASDGGGSIRIPASCCGLVGLKISALRAPTNGIPDPGIPLSVQGCVSRSVRDTAQWLATTEDKNGPLTPVGMVSAPNKKRLRIGLYMADTMGRDPKPHVAAAIEDVAKLCAELGHQIEPRRWSIDGEAFADAFSLVWASVANAASAQAQMIKPNTPLEDLLEPLTISLAEMFRSAPDGAFAKALGELDAVALMYDALFGDLDVILTPVLADTPPMLGEIAPSVGLAGFAKVRDYVAYTPLQNSAGAPAISLPLSMSPDGLPIGAHFAAAKGQERTLLELAYELEQAAPWTGRRPPVWA
jgi:amidase